MFDFMPTALKTTSPFKVDFLLLDSIVTSTLSPIILESTTFDEFNIWIPDFFKIFDNSLEISLSSMGAIFFSYSTKVTLVPIEL